MKIYFAGSIRGVKPDSAWIQTLIKHVSRHGEVLTEKSFSDDPKDQEPLNDQQIYERDMSWLRETDAFVAEVTTPSLGVGYEIAKAEMWGKPLLLLYRQKPGGTPSAMLNGNNNLSLIRYMEEKDAIKAVNEFLKTIKGKN